jgi:hypothetical protein
VFFLSYRRAAAGDLRAGVIAGLAVGLLFLARAEGALFGLPLLVLLRSRVARRAGIAGSGIALVIGLGWFARDLVLGASSDVFARSVLIVRYEDFFASAPPPLPALDQLLAPKPAALVTNAVTFAFAFGLLLLPGLMRAAWARRRQAAVRAFAGLLILVYLVESLVFTLHSTHGSYFHSLAAFLPFGVALGVTGTGELLRTIERGRVAAIGGVAAAIVVSVFALAQWDASFNPPYRERVAAVASIPAAPFYAIDAAAWRWIADRPAIVTPSGGMPCAPTFGADVIVLEPAHFSAYSALYEGSRPIAEVGAIRVFPFMPPPSSVCRRP